MYCCMTLHNVHWVSAEDGLSNGQCRKLPTLKVQQHHLMAIFQDNLGKPISRYQNVSILNSEQAVVTTGAIRCAKLQSSCHYQHTITQHTGSPFCRPTNSVGTERRKYHTPWTCSHGLPSLS